VNEMLLFNDQFNTWLLLRYLFRAKLSPGATCKLILCWKSLTRFSLQQLGLSLILIQRFYLSQGQSLIILLMLSRLSHKSRSLQSLDLKIIG
jgi:hypothetical protein